MQHRRWSIPPRLAVAARALAAAAVLPMTSHAEDTNMQHGDVSGRWVLVSVAGRPVAQDPPIFFRLANGILTGFDGCNRFAGPIATPSAIRAGGRGCPDDHLPFPLDLSVPAEQLSRAIRDGERLILPLADGAEAVFIQRAE